jgi:hypothetical protein
MIFGSRASWFHSATGPRCKCQSSARFHLFWIGTERQVERTCARTKANPRASRWPCVRTIGEVHRCAYGNHRTNELVCC